MRNILLALTTGLVAGQAFAYYRELKLKRINELERRIDQLLESAPITIDAPSRTPVKLEVR